MNLYGNLIAGRRDQAFPVLSEADIGDLIAGAMIEKTAGNGRPDAPASPLRQD